MTTADLVRRYGIHRKTVSLLGLRNPRMSDLARQILVNDIKREGCTYPRSMAAIGMPPGKRTMVCAEIEQPTMGSLFAGIGGFDLGFERAGFEIAWQVEIDPYCRKVLERHFPHAKRFPDVREVGKHNLQPVDVLCGGFPCQDISNAGKRAGIDGERSGLWGEYARIIGELRPRYVVVENVAALLGRGMGRVLGDLAALGYDAEWEIISAADVGAPHLRERVWIVAYAANITQREPSDQTDTLAACGQARLESFDGGADVADAEECRRGAGRTRRSDPGCARQSEQPLQTLADASRARLSQRIMLGAVSGEEELGDAGQTSFVGGEDTPDADIFPAIRAAIARGECGDWEPEPGFCRVAHGVPARVDRLKALGNAVVPQIPELIARRILETM
ncbi:MAG TPA: DNA cytosine methyltransferase [Acidobacteriaceae bacterium]|nr:DNA cytosine methyltransferase [Acidobacteriaceae bacterium]